MTNILIVDDEADICWALEMTLREEGYGVTCTTTGEEALRKIQERAVDVVLIDVKLPGIGGLDLSRLIRARDPGVKVILISGYLYEDDPPIQEGIQSGDYMGFISKPFDLNSVSALVREVALQS